MSDKTGGGGLLAHLRKGPMLILLALLGIVLIVWGSTSHDSEQSATSQGGTDKATDPLYEYTEMTERKIAALCEQVQGVSGVCVAVSFEGDFTYVYATDSDTHAQDGASESKLSYVTVGSGSSEQTVLLTRQFPRVSGVGIVCRGGGKAEIRQELLLLLEAAYGIPAHKIYIAEANS